MRYAICITYFIAILLCISCINKTAVSANRVPSSLTDNRQSNISNEILVKFAPETTSEAIETIQKRLGLETVRIISKPNLYLMKIKGKSSVEEIIKYLKEYDEVLYAEPEHIYKMDTE